MGPKEPQEERRTRHQIKNKKRGKLEKCDIKREKVSTKIRGVALATLLKTRVA